MSQALGIRWLLSMACSESPPLRKLSFLWRCFLILWVDLSTRLTVSRHSLRPQTTITAVQYMPNIHVCYMALYCSFKSVGVSGAILSSLITDLWANFKYLLPHKQSETFQGKLCNGYAQGYLWSLGSSWPPSETQARLMVSQNWECDCECNSLWRRNPRHINKIKVF